jgi:uncharacterized phage protein (TIGR01671 family)
MNDRFKLRAWDKEYGEMLYGASFRADGDITFTDGYILSEKECVVMQCVGLTDKNGKLIYEGDVLGLPNQQNGGKFVIRWENAGAEFWAVDRDNHGGNAESFLSWAAIAGREQVIILGNIYENPGLLGGTNET